MNRPRRIRSPPPPLGYDPRMMAGGGNGSAGGSGANSGIGGGGGGRIADHHQRPPPDYEDLPYAPGPTFEPQPPPPQPPQAFVETSNHHPSQSQAPYSIGNSGNAGYRDHRLPSTYRATLQQRELPPNLYANQTSKSSSAAPIPYKILCITNISHKISDNIVKDALTSDFSRFGDISVSICHDSGERLAYIYFRSYEEAREARHVKSRTLLFDRPIEIEPIYESNKPSPSGSPPISPPTIPFTRRRSITPPEYYGVNGPPPPAPAPQPPMRRHQTSNPISPHHQSLSSPNYPHHISSRYPQAPIPPMAPVSYGRHYISPPGHLPPPSPYNSPPHPDPYYHRSYSHLPPPTPHSNPFSSTGHSYHHQHHHQPPPPPPLYGHPPASRDHRDSGGGHMIRSPHREDIYHPIDQRSYPFPSSRSSSSLHSNHHLGHSNMLPNFYPHPSPAGRGRSPPPPPQHSMHPRYMSRDFRREKYGIRDGFGFNEFEEGKPSRVLFITNIDSSKSEADIRDIFESFGVIEEIEMKKIGADVASALIKFSSMDCAYKAKTATNWKYLGSMKCRISYGKVSTSRRLWIGGLGPSTTLARLEDEFGKFGNIINLDYISGRPYAYIEYETANQAQFATHHLKGTLAADSERRIRIEFVDPTDRNSDKTSSTRHDSSSVQISDVSSRSRTTNESWSTNEHEEASPQLNSLKRRSISPSDGNSKRIALSNQSLSDHRANIFSKASSARSSTNSPANVENTNREDANELNNNSESKTNIESNDSAVIERTPSEHPNDSSMINRMAQSKSIREVVDCCSVSWFCQLVLRNFNFPSKMHMCSGRTATIEKYITKLNGENGGDQCPPILRITQRWRLHPQPKLEEVKRRMQTGNLGMLIITSTPEQSPILSSPICKTPQSSTSQTTQSKQNGGDGTTSQTTPTAGSTQHSSTSDVEGGAGGNSSGGGDKTAQQIESASESSTTQSRPLKNLISYLEQKDAAGVISLTALDHNDKSVGGGSDGSSKLLYAFPPGDFALNLLKQKASNLSPDVTREEFLLGVIVGGSEGNKI